MNNKIFGKIGEFNDSFDEAKIKRAIAYCDEKCKNSGVGCGFVSELMDIVLPLRSDEATIIAAFLHVLFLEGKLDIKDIRDEFGDDVSTILIGLKNLDKLNYAENDHDAQLEALRRMFLVIAKDVRVILLGLSCMLYKMRHIEELIEKDDWKIFSQEICDLYVPIAARLGIYTIKGELEDLAFKYTHADEHAKVLKQLGKLRKSCQLSIDFIKKQLDSFLISRGVAADVSGRLKNVYSIYKKLERKGLANVSDLYDIFAMRVILPTRRDESGNQVLDHLYSTLGLIHSEWKPISKKFRDYLAVPKPNGYRSLHTVVLGLAPEDRDQPVEIQIRDSEMDQEANYGVASHWSYKDSANNDSNDLKSQIDWIKGLEKVRGDFDVADEIDIFNDRIFALTPRGAVKNLPFGATPVDFAYSVHTDIGNRCVMAKVNGSVVPLDYELKNGDVVEVITKKVSSPKLQWLSIVKTNFAKNKIKMWFSSMNHDNNVREGKRLINKQLERIGKPPLDQKYSIFKEFANRKLTLKKRETLIEEVGTGAKSARDVVRKVYPYERFADYIPLKDRSRGVVKKQSSMEDQVLIGGESGLPIKAASCCKPNIGDSIVGYVTRGNRITIHKSSCILLNSLSSERVIYANWKDVAGEGDRARYMMPIKILAMRRVGLMRDVTSVISSLNMVIRDVSIRQIKGGVSE
ncbi:MAG: HD domain-containing protein, partial [Candidatus Peregrinibacteria bacterium]